MAEQRFDSNVLKSLPLDIQLMTMDHLDVFSLHSLVRTLSVYKEPAEAYFGHVLSEILARSLPRDIQELVCILLSIEDSAPFQDSEVPRVLGNVSFNQRTTLFGFKQSPKDEVKCLHKLTRIFAAVQFLQTCFPASMLPVLANSKSGNLTRSKHIGSSAAYGALRSAVP